MIISFDSYSRSRIHFNSFCCVFLFINFLVYHTDRTLEWRFCILFGGCLNGPNGFRAIFYTLNLLYRLPRANGRIMKSKREFKKKKLMNEKCLMHSFRSVSFHSMKISLISVELLNEWMDSISWAFVRRLHLYEVERSYPASLAKKSKI